MRTFMCSSKWTDLWEIVKKYGILASESMLLLLLVDLIQK